MSDLTRKEIVMLLLTQKKSDTELLNWTGLLLNDLDLSNLDFSYINFSKTNFTNSNLEGCNFMYSNLKNAIFNNTSLNGIDFSHSKNLPSLRYCTFPQNITLDYSEIQTDFFTLNNQFDLDDKKHTSFVRFKKISNQSIKNVVTDSSVSEEYRTISSTELHDTEIYNVSGISFKNCDLFNCSINLCDLDYDNISFRSCYFENCKISMNTSYQVNPNYLIDNCQFNNCEIRFECLKGSKLNNLHFNKCQITNFICENSEISGKMTIQDSTFEYNSKFSFFDSKVKNDFSLEFSNNYAFLNFLEDSNFTETLLKSEIMYNLDIPDYDKKINVFIRKYLIKCG